MTWPHRVNLIVPANILSIAAKIGQVFDPDSGGSKTFSVELSANGKEPTTHYGASTAANDEFVENLENILNKSVSLHDVITAHNVNAAYVVAISDEECNLFLQNVTVSINDPTWDDLLNSLSLKIVRREEATF